MLKHFSIDHYTNDIQIDTMDESAEHTGGI